MTEDERIKLAHSWWNHYCKPYQQIKEKMSDSRKKYEEMQMEKASKPQTIDGIGVVEVFETEYPELAEEYKRIGLEMYEMFAAKHMDYGLNNIALGGDIIHNEDDKKFSLTGLAIRLTDKISRLKNLLVNGKNYVRGEGMEDTFIDIANYGIIGLLVGRNKWKK
tara:strand:- start:192 stop:683 length:492 start_codon:yes stop_codon:yes gene_type:complete